METLNGIKSKLIACKQDLKKKYHIKDIAIFGSVSRAESTENSDVDILVDFSQPVGIEFIDLADELEQLLNTKIDLVSRNGIKPKYFEKIKNDLVYV